MNLLLNGRPFNPKDFKDALMAKIIQQLADNLRQRIGSIREPDTGEFPTIVVHGTTLDDLRLTVEGSDALLALVNEALGENIQAEDGASETHEEGPAMSKLPHVFLSWGSPDKELASRLAAALRSSGIETWFSEWEITPGDSFRQKIEAGLGDCTHFIVLLTPNSIDRPWVKIEIDAGLIQKIEEGRKFIPLRSGLEPKALPPLLRTLHAPELKDFERDVQQLVNDIHGVARKPPLGPAPAVKAQGRVRRLSDAATSIARLFVERSEHGGHRDPVVKLSDLATATSLTVDDVKDAVHELRDGLKLSSGFSGMEPTVAATRELFSEFDKHWMGWDPEADAVRVATELMNDPEFPRSLEKIASELDWPARRLNPAVTFLRQRDLVRVREALSTGPFVALSIDATDSTRRFVKSRA